MSKKLLYLMTFVMLLGIVAVPAIATTYYVDQDHTNADDTNAGTSESAPWETLLKACNTADAGDTVYVKAGTYIDTTNTTYRKFRLVNNGTAANPITFISSPARAAVVRSESLPSSRDSYAWALAPGSEYIIIDGFKIEGGIIAAEDGASYITIRNCEVIYGSCPDSDPSLNWGITLYRADHCTVENNYVHDITSSNYTGRNAAGIMLILEETDYNIIQGNTVDVNSQIKNCYGTKGGSVDNNIWRYNVAMNATVGYHVMGSTGEDVNSSYNHLYQNIAIDCGSAFDTGYATDQCYYYNNTAVDCDWFFSASMITNTDHEFWNNILVGTDDTAIRWSGYPTAEPFTSLIEYSNYNCFYNCDKIAYREKLPSLTYSTLSAWETAWGFDADSITSDPDLVGSGDYSLDTGSPCIDAGVDLQDYDDDQNTSESINMGAYITGNETIGHDWGASAPTKATGPSPTNSATSVSITADLSWTAGSGSTSSDVYFGTDSTPDSGEDQGNQTATTYDPGTLSTSTTYYWRIDEINSEGTTTGDVWNFTTTSGSAPGAASSPSPSNSATDVNVTTDLSWTAGSGATSHDVYFGTTSPGNSQGNQTATTFDTATMDANKTYYWRIDEVNANGTTTGTVWSFATSAGSGETIKINFQPSGSTVPTGYEKDYGQTYGSQGNGLSYGWGASDNPQARDRVLHADQRYDTLCHLSTNHTWEIGLDNGTYNLWVVCGDPEYADSTNTIDIEGTVCTDPDGEDYFDEYNIQVTVSDGRLTIDPATGADNPKICFIEITSATVEAPGQATNPSPANSATGVSITADLSWTADANATSHDVYFGTSSPGTFQGNQTATTFDTGTMTNNTTYYWRIDEVNSGGTTTGTVWSFTTIVAAPAAASSPSPANSATGVSITADLSWSAGSGATSRDVYFGTSSPGSFQGNQTATTFNAGTMTNNMTYYWRIDEVNAGGTTTGTVWSFTTIVAAPAAATSPSPSNSATGVSITADLSWSAGAGATSHDVYFGTSSPGTSQGNQTATTFDTGTMTNNTTYYWRIDEVNAGGMTTGTVWSFTTIVAAPGAASSPSPANSDTGVSVTADLSWTAGSGATSRDVYFGTTSPGTYQGNLTATTFDTGTMTNNTTYYWRIDEVNASGTTTGTVWSFTTEQQQVTVDANLVGWWRFENNAYDSAGTNDGTIYGAVDATGKIGQALSFDEVNDHVTVPDFDYTNSSDEFSLSFWFKIADVAGSGYQYMYSHGTITADNSLNVYFSEADEGTGGEELRTWIALGDSTDWYSVSDPDFVDGQWHLYTITVSSVNGAKIYVDANSILTDPNIKGSSMNPASSIYIGARNDLNADRYYGNSSTDDGLLDDVRLYDRALSQTDISVLFSGVSPIATNPNPADSANDVSVDAVLTWTAGDYADTHDVYLGTDANNVADANNNSNEFMENVDVNNYDPGTLDYDTTYYWAIDEVNDTTTWAGDVWSFTTEEQQTPGAASSPSPANSAADVSITADLSWTAGSGSTSSDVYFGTTSPGTFQGNQTATTFDTGTMDNDTTYYWRIDEVNAAGTTTGTVWSFTTIVVAPGAATNPSPANSATDVSTTADLSWTAGSGSTSSDVYFGTTSPGTSQGNQTATTFDTGTMDNDTTYYWRIDEINAAGTTTGTVWSFTTATAGETIKINFQPSASAVPTGYEVDSGATYASRGNGLSYGWDTTNGDTRDRGVDSDQRYDTLNHFYTNTWEIGLDNGTYNVWVVFGDPDYADTTNTMDIEGTVCTDPDGEDHFDEYNIQVSVTDGKLTIEPATGADNPKICFIEITSASASAPGAASSPSPSNNATGISTSANLSWTSGSGSTSSDVYFGTDSTPDSGEDQGNQTATTYEPGTLSNSTTYYWRIDEINAQGTTTGTVWSFTTTSGSAPGAASNPSPANNATGVSVTADLSWTAGSGSTSSDVYFGTDSTPDAGEDQGNQTATTYDPGTMDANTTYYWRIDEINAQGTTTGTVWSFTPGSLTAVDKTGSISSNETWSGLINIVGDVTITADVNVEPGTQIDYDGDYFIKASSGGTLSLNGTASSPIFVDASSTGGDLEIIGGQAVIRFTRLERVDLMAYSHQQLIFEDNIHLGTFSAEGQEGITLKRNYISPVSGSYGLAGAPDGSVMTDNVIDGGTWVASAPGGVVRGNVFISEVVPNGGSQDNYTHEHMVGVAPDVVIERNIFIGKSYGAIMPIGSKNGTDALIRNNTFDMRGNGKGIYYHLTNPLGSGLVARNNLFMRCDGIYDEQETSDAVDYADYNLFADVGDRYEGVVITGKDIGDDGFGLHDVVVSEPNDVCYDPTVGYPLPYTNAQLINGEKTIDDILELYRDAYAPKAGSSAIDAGSPADANDPLVTDGDCDIGAVEY